MMKKFRGEVFDLCNTLKSMGQFNDLRNVLSSLRFSSDHTILDPKIDVCSNGILLRAEFYGILLAFQNKLSSFPNVEEKTIELNENEYSTIAYGHCYISNFIDLCLNDIATKNKTIAKMLSPYSFFVPIKSIPKNEIDLTIFDNAVNAFKNSSVYRSITDSNILMAFEKVPEDVIKNLFGVLYKDIIQAPLDTVSNEILSLKVREQGFKPNQQINPVDALQLISFKLIALREMLSIAASLMYDAMLGCDLIIIDENSLINIEKNSSNAIYSYKTVLIQGGILSPFNDILNRTLLLSIDTGKAKIHDFGRAYSSTFSFANENGDTTKLSFCVLDEELNPISNLTNK